MFPLHQRDVNTSYQLLDEATGLLYHFFEVLQVFWRRLSLASRFYSLKVLNDRTYLRHHGRKRRTVPARNLLNIFIIIHMYVCTDQQSNQTPIHTYIIFSKETEVRRCDNRQRGRSGNKIRSPNPTTISTELD